MAIASRLITLIMLLQRQPNQKAADLAEKLGVSVRTLHRYIAMLDEIGIPVYSERGPNGGFSLVRGYRMPPLVFTPEEAVAVCLGAGLVEQVWGQLYREAARGALAKLENVLPDEQRGEVAWANRSLIAAGLLRPDLNTLSPLLEKIRQAIHECRRLRMNYRSGGSDQPLIRQVDPYALVHRWGWWYAIGFCHLRRSVRMFRIDRMEEVALLDERFVPPKDFDAHAYLEGEPAAQPQVCARLRFAPQAASIAYMNRLTWREIQNEADGAVIVTALFPDLIWAASTTLAFGALVTVLEPPELRQMVREWAAEIIKNNSLYGD